MDEKLQSFINGIGALTELWIISYRGFKQQGLGHEESLQHTKEFMALIMESVIGKKG